MSTSLAIAAVSAVLKDLLNNGLIDHDWAASVGPVTITTLPPDRVAPNGASEQNQLNLFLYHATPNPGWRNVGLPSRDSQGERVGNPPLALDLHYLLTAYGRQDLHAEILLGYAMQQLHETPVLTRAAIRNSLNLVGPILGMGLPANSLLSTANLAEQVEQIKICPQSLSMEEMSKLWTAFQTHYRPTAAYQASVVLIQSRRPSRSALPVRERQLYVLPFRQPTIQAVEPQMVEYAPAATIALRGLNLRAPNTVVQFGAREAEPDLDHSTDERLVVALPTGLQAGINPVQVVQRLMMGQPTLHRGFESNVAAFVLRPQVRKKRDTGGAELPDYDLDVVRVPTIGNQPPRATVTVRIAPEVGREQQVALLLNELTPPDPDVPARVYRFEAPSRAEQTAESTGEIVFETRGVLPGEYLVRVQVDGAQSPLDLDAQQRFTGPRITL